MKTLFLMTFLTLNVFAAENTVSTQVQLPKWKTSFNSYFYDFEGTRASNRADYKFGDTKLKMQMMSLQYQFSNGWTLTGVASYLETDVDTQFVGAWYKDSSKGLGDTVITGAKPILMDGSFMLIADVGVSLPTGSITEKNKNNPSGDVNYPYNMQMGSGTTDGLAGLTALWLQPKYQLGGRIGTTLRTGEKNSEDYRLGNQYRADAWLDVPMKYGFTPRLVGYYRYRDAIEGADKTYGRNLFVEFYHHSQINWDVSAAVKYNHSFTPLLAVNAEAGIPVAQDSQNYDNVVVSTEYYMNLGITGSF